ncbi:unnamed protein product [Cladocopium goreaui]|uniref:Uncharacterized protein n=1 Tax=Cladocopium goreaui TaxID=2562237 RepID=A0A9P1BVS5_9DINO|nr:unnamed protein product [Cladocopium goreaui]
MYAIGKKVSESSLTFADVMQPCPSFAVEAYMGKNKDEEIEKIPLAILAETKIDLGKAKMNQTFAQAFQDKEWTNYMLTRFEDSQKPTHQKYFQYVKLMIQEDSQPSTSTVKTKVNTKKKEEMKTTRLGMVKPVDEEEEEDSDWERMTGVPTQQMTEIQINQNEMESRMGRMEEALAQVISHLQQLSTQGLLIQPKAEM